MKIMDTYKNQVIHMNRPLACSTCWFPCCLQSMEVSAPPGNVIGRVEQEWSLCYPSFAIKNHSGETVLRIEGPICTFSICGDVEFKVNSTICLLCIRIKIEIVYVMRTTDVNPLISIFSPDRYNER